MGSPEPADQVEDIRAALAVMSRPLASSGGAGDPAAQIVLGGEYRRPLAEQTDEPLADVAETDQGQVRPH
jgi:hypothetical protein